MTPTLWLIFSFPFISHQRLIVPEYLFTYTESYLVGWLCLDLPLGMTSPTYEKLFKVPACSLPKDRRANLAGLVRFTFPGIWDLSKVINRQKPIELICSLLTAVYPGDPGEESCVLDPWFYLCSFLPMEFPVLIHSILVSEPGFQAIEKLAFFFFFSPVNFLLV